MESPSILYFSLFSLIYIFKLKIFSYFFCICMFDSWEIKFGIPVLINEYPPIPPIHARVLNMKNTNSDKCAPSKFLSKIFK